MKSKIPNKGPQRHETKAKKLINGFALVMNEPTINFPNSDTAGGILTFEEGANPPIFYGGATDYNPIVKDPIISEVGFINPNDGGGIIAGTLSNNNIDLTNNPAAETPNTSPQTIVESQENVKPPAKKFPLAIIIVVLIVIAGIIYLSKHKSILK